MLVEVLAASYMATGLNFENRAVEVLTRRELKFYVCLHAKRTHLPVLCDIDIAGYPRIKHANTRNNHCMDNHVCLRKCISLKALSRNTNSLYK